MPLDDKDRTWLNKHFSKTSDLQSLIKKAVHAAIAPLQKEIADLKGQLAQKDARIKDLEAQLNESISRNSSLIQQRAGNEQYSKKQNVRVSGITYIEKETPAALQIRVIEELNKAGANITNNDIFRLHHLFLEQDDRYIGRRSLFHLIMERLHQHIDYKKEHHLMILQ